MRLLTKPQYDKLSDLSLGLGQIFFGSTVVPYVVPTIDKPSIIVLIFGIGFAVGFMEFNQTTIGYLLFYLTGGVLLMSFILLYMASKKR